VQCAAARYSTITVTVEADDLETALVKAIAEADMDAGWEACDGFAPTFVEAVAKGAEIELWAIDFEQQLAVPERFTEQGTRR
jgi:hypothetical protein